MKHLRLEDGIVQEVLIAPVLPPFHPDLNWVSVPETDPVTEGWVQQPDGSFVDPRSLRTLEEAQEEKKAEIKATYEQALAAGYTCSNGIKMDATPDAVQLLDGGVRLAQKVGSTTISIRDYNNVVHPNMLVSDVDNMVSELALNAQTLLEKKWTLQHQVDAATTLAEVDAITW